MQMQSWDGHGKENAHGTEIFGQTAGWQNFKKEVLGYAGICLVLLLFLGAGGMLSRTFPVRALVNALIYLLVGGLGMSVWISCFRPG